MEETEIVELWDLFSEHIPEKHKELAAEQYVNHLVEHGTELTVLEEIIGSNDYLDNAIEELLDENTLAELGEDDEGY